MGINTTNISLNSTYIQSTDSFDEILKSHCKFIESVGLEICEEDKNLPCLYWTSKLHKVPFKHRFIAGSSKCTTKDLSCLFSKVLTTVKVGLIRYNNTKTNRNGVNSMWIVKNSTSLLSSLDQLDVRKFLDNMIRGGHRKLARSFNLCYRYIDDLIVFNNKKFGDYVKEIYLPINC